MWFTAANSGMMIVSWWSESSTARRFKGSVRSHFVVNRPRNTSPTTMMTHSYIATLLLGRTTSSQVGLVAASYGFDFVEYSTSSGLLSSPSAWPPAALLMTLSDDDDTGPRLQRQLRNALEPTSIIFVSPSNTTPEAMEAKRQGALVVSQDKLSEAMIKELIPRAVVCSDLRRRWLDQVNEQRRRFSSLTWIQMQLLRLEIAGYTNDAIATNLGTSSSFVEQQQSLMLEQTHSTGIAGLFRKKLLAEAKRVSMYSLYTVTIPEADSSHSLKMRGTLKAK